MRGCRSSSVIQPCKRMNLTFTMRWKRRFDDRKKLYVENAIKISKRRIAKQWMSWPGEWTGRLGGDSFHFFQVTFAGMLIFFSIASAGVNEIYFGDSILVDCRERDAHWISARSKSSRSREIFSCLLHSRCETLVCLVFNFNRVPDSGKMNLEKVEKGDNNDRDGKNLQIVLIKSFYGSNIKKKRDVSFAQ